jgi:hypothetical protein
VLAYKAELNNLTARNQQRNWQVVYQLSQLRIQPEIITTPTAVETNVFLYNFGSNFKGIHRIWHTVFAVENPVVFEKEGNITGYLYDDFANIPMIVGLEETAKFEKNCLITSGKDTNICFYTREQWTNKGYEINFDSFETK